MSHPNDLPTAAANVGTKTITTPLGAAPSVAVTPRTAEHAEPASSMLSAFLAPKNLALAALAAIAFGAAVGLEANNLTNYLQANGKAKIAVGGTCLGQDDKDYDCSPSKPSILGCRSTWVYLDGRISDDGGEGTRAYDRDRKDVTMVKLLTDREDGALAHIDTHTDKCPDATIYVCKEVRRNALTPEQYWVSRQWEKDGTETGKEYDIFYWLCGVCTEIPE